MGGGGVKPIWDIVPKFSRFWIMMPPLSEFGLYWTSQMELSLATNGHHIAGDNLSVLDIFIQMLKKHSSKVKSSWDRLSWTGQVGNFF